VHANKSVHYTETYKMWNFLQVVELTRHGWPPPVVVINRCPQFDTSAGWSFVIGAFGKLSGFDEKQYTLVAVVLYISTPTMKHYTCRVLGSSHALGYDPAKDTISDRDERDRVEVDGKVLHWWSVDSLNGSGVPMAGSPTRWHWEPTDLTQPTMMIFVKSTLLRSPD
jgi:hypothetical protein